MATKSQIIISLEGVLNKHRSKAFVTCEEEKIIELLIASGNVTVEKVDQARKLALSLKWDEAAQQGVQADGVEWRCKKCEAMNYGDCWKCGSHHTPAANASRWKAERR